MSETIGHYDILALVGSGGLGSVYRARDTRVGRTVAIRVLAGALTDPLQRARAIDLIQPFTALSHPHVATLFEVGEHKGSIYLVYEYVPGETLAAQTSGSPLNLRRALDLAGQLADALAEAHALDLVHGALSPTSVIVTPKGHAKILDFGLTAWTRDDVLAHSVERLSAAGGVLGPSAVASMAPEQLLGQPVDHRADLFAFGVLFYEMLTGRQPFASQKPGDVGLKVLQSKPTSPGVLNPDVPAAIDAIALRALAKNPDERYQNAATLAAELRDVSTSEHERDIAADPGLLKAPDRRSPWRAVVLGTLMLAAIVLAVWQWQEPVRQLWQGRFGKAPDPQIVVVPFAVRSSDVSRPYFGSGFAEDLARRLGQVPGLTTRGRSSIRTFAGKTPQTAAADVFASYALTGAIEPADDEWKALRIDVRLIDRLDGRSVWSHQYAGETHDVISLQARIAWDVSDWLHLGAQSKLEQGRTALRLVDPVAYDLYLQARDALAAHDASRAAQIFETVIETDPSLLEAHTGLAEALSVNATFDGRVSLASVLPRMRDAADAASTTDPDVAATRLAMGLAAPTIKEAIEHFRRAIELDRSDPVAYLALADALREVDPSRSVRFTRKAIELDPRLPLAHYRLAEANLAVGEFNEALVEAARGQALAPSLPWWEAMRLRIWLVKAAVPDAAPAPIGHDASDFPPLAILRAGVMRAAGQRTEAGALLAALTRLYPDACEVRAMTAAVRFQGAERADALRTAGEVLAESEASGAQMAWARCAAMAAAAIDDAPRAATWMARAASTDDGVRLWGRVNGVLSPSAGMRQGLFPWSALAKDANVRTAVARLDAAIARARADAARILEGL